MTLVESAIWIIILTAAATANLAIAFSFMKDVREGSPDAVAMFLFNFLVGLVCIGSCCLTVKDIAEYEKTPKVITSQAPVIRGPIRNDGDTLYVFYFKDNIPQDQLKAHQ